MTTEFIKATQTLLNREEELELFELWWIARECGYRKEENKLFSQIITQFSPIIKKLVRKMNGYNMDYDEMTSEALYALVAAAINFDRELGIRFGTYASICVTRSLFTFVTKNYFITNVCANQYNKKLFFRLRRIMSEHIAATGNMTLPLDKIEEIAVEVGTTPKVVENMCVMIREPFQSLNQKLGDSEDSMTREDLLESNDLEQSEKIGMQQTNDLIHQLVNGAISELDERSQVIIREQALREDNQTLDALGRQFSVSKERIRQVRNKAQGEVARIITDKLAALNMTPADLFT